MATFKLDGARFDTLEELKKTLWILYQDKMSQEEFDKYVEDNVESKDD